MKVFHNGIIIKDKDRIIYHNKRIEKTLRINKDDHISAEREQFNKETVNKKIISSLK